MLTFKVLDVLSREDEYGHTFTQARVAMPVKDWAKAKRLGQLGMLYGVDISNTLYREHNVQAYNPTVDDRQRASQGVKIIRLVYYKPVTLRYDSRPALRLVQGGKG